MSSQEPAPAPVPPVPEAPSRRPLPPPHRLRSTTSGLTLPRAVERIEQLERRIQELEQFRAGAGTAAVVSREPGPKVQPDRAKATRGREP